MDAWEVYGYTDVPSLVMKLAYNIFVTILRALSYMADFLDTVAGVKLIEYNGVSMPIYDLFFQASPISALYWGITIIGLILAVVFSIIAVGRRMTDLEAEKSMGQTLGQIGRSMLMFLISPLVMLTVMILTSAVMTKTDEIFSMTAGGYEMDSTVFALTVREAVIDDDSVVAKFARGELQYDNAYHVLDNLYPENMKFWIGIPVSVILFVMYFVIILMLTVRLFMMIVLYLISPFFIASMVLDDGARYRTWRNAFFARLVSGYSILIAVKLMIYIIIPFLTGNYALHNTVFGDIVLKLLLLCGCIYAAYKSTNTLMKIISPQTEGEDTVIIGAAKAMFRKSVGKGVKAAKRTILLAVEAVKAAVKAGVKVGYGVADIAAGEKASGVAAIGGAALGLAKDVGGMALGAGKDVAEEAVGGAIDAAKTITQDK